MRRGSPGGVLDVLDGMLVDVGNVAGAASHTVPDGHSAPIALEQPRVPAGMGAEGARIPRRHPVLGFELVTAQRTPRYPVTNDGERAASHFDAPRQPSAMPPSSASPSSSKPSDADVHQSNWAASEDLSANTAPYHPFPSSSDVPQTSAWVGQASAARASSLRPSKVPRPETIRSNTSHKDSFKTTPEQRKARRRYYVNDRDKWLEQMADYRQSSAGKACYERYRKSDACKQAIKRYKQSERGREAQERYKASRRARRAAERAERRKSSSQENLITAS